MSRASDAGRRRRLAPEAPVFVGLGALVALLAGAVGLAVFLIVALEDDSAYVSDRPFRYATAIHEAALEAKGIANNERGFLISGDRVFVAELEERTALARAAFATAVADAPGSAERRAATEAQAGFERWQRALRRDIAAYRAGDHDRAIASSLGPTRALRKAYEESLERGHTLGLRSIDAAKSSLSDSASRSVTILLAYLGLALLAGVAVAIWVVRAILTPSFHLTRSALDVLRQARVLVEEDERGSHRATGVEVPIEAVNALAESALEVQDVLLAVRRRRAPA
jgi:methyl-accepting chemotaxis protein